MPDLANSSHSPNSTHFIPVPNPVDEFGEDGGQFYRCYDALAQELDDDMTIGLKEQLEGLLIFAGLFAGINTAFLALTLPLMTANPGDDTNALLAQNNAILFAISLGRNDSIPAEASPLPSAGFTPARNIFVVNVLFALSLAFAIVASFLAVLGRQWLVYYRRRSGGGPDRQRWEQLGRFLGAERWRMQLVLDDILPSLLQIGLVIFCISFILYLHILNPSASFIVAVPFYLGLAVLVLTAIFASWDQFCPYQTPLSHLLVWASQPLWKPLFLMGNLFWVFWSMLWPPDVGYHPALQQKVREGDLTSSLRATALKRAICTSDDPTTLLNTAANIFAVTNDASSQKILSDDEFLGRSLQLCGKSSRYAFQSQGYPQEEGYAAVARLYLAAFTHILLPMYSSIPEAHDWASALMASFEGGGHPLWLIPEHHIPTCSPTLIRTSLAFSLLRSLLISRPIGRLSNYLTSYSTALPISGWQVLPLFAMAIQMLAPAGVDPDKHWERHMFSRDKLVGFYTGDTLYTPAAIEGIEEAARGLSQHVYAHLVDCNKILVNILSSASIVAINALQQPDLGIENRTRLFLILEKCMRSSEFPAELRDEGRAIRAHVVMLLENLLDAQAAAKRIATSLLQLLGFFFAELLVCQRTEPWIDEDIEVLRLFGPLLLKLQSYGLSRCEDFISRYFWSLPIAYRAQARELSRVFTGLFRAFNDFRRTAERKTLALQVNLESHLAI
ncbi:hypothetical protein M407DRAFT_24661 [Tulasnella calospora MUT 4182]|uniref:DUF6535 domain-containing protein n=1 Tax=Tulasnella calospora MUT 4182 TaxID=1051891 RepID=A0A0C3KX31_9AGAM|nr:hypothetical protein M407DRAFT_24661 [Tulasnella calospora MUT 4182]